MRGIAVAALVCALLGLAACSPKDTPTPSPPVAEVFKPSARTGQYAFEARYDGARGFTEGLAAVKIGGLADGKWGYIDAAGAMVIAPQFELAEPFSEGLAAVMKSGGWGYIDKTGTMLIDTQYGMAASFREGLAAVGEEDGQSVRWGFIDREGRVVIAPGVTGHSMEQAPAFVAGLARARVGPVTQVGQAETGRVGFIDRTGKAVIEPVFDYATPFADGLAAVGIDAVDDASTSWGFIRRD
jgi:hypothetical protein